MTICEPFWTNEMPLANVIRGFYFRLMLAYVVCAPWITMQSHPAKAMFVDQMGGAVEDASLEAFKECSAADGGDQCGIIKMWVDPPANGVSSFHLALSFDPTQFTFDPRRSGPLCSFADDNTPCPPPRASLGTSLIREDNTPPGIPPAGFILTYTEPTSGVLVVDYTLPTPVDLSTDQNVFALAFDLLSPIPANVPLFASSFGTSGAHQFNQIAFSCNGGTIHCSGVPPILGLDISTVSGAGACFCRDFRYLLSGVRVCQNQKVETSRKRLIPIHSSGAPFYL
jgi:hypothetical protein